MSDKPKCPVFGCTIPRGIPHEHPAGVSAVMRDPALPLNAAERLELDAYRRMSNANGLYVIPPDVQIVPGRKLRDALLMAGAKSGDKPKETPVDRRRFLRLVTKATVVILLVAGAFAPALMRNL